MLLRECDAELVFLSMLMADVSASITMTINENGEGARMFKCF